VFGVDVEGFGGHEVGHVEDEGVGGVEVYGGGREAGEGAGLVDVEVVGDGAVALFELGEFGYSTFALLV
jgi:hypothetical protein